MTLRISTRRPSPVSSAWEPAFHAREAVCKWASMRGRIHDHHDLHDMCTLKSFAVDWWAISLLEFMELLELLYFHLFVCLKRSSRRGGS